MNNKPSNLWSIERLEKMTPTDRGYLFVNAQQANNPEGEALVLLIQQSGLTLADGNGMTREHPIVVGMDAIINSDADREACRQAVEEGLPALAGVDPLLAAEFPADYGKHNQTTDWAGYLVAEVMRSMGFKQLQKKGKLPEGCVAQTAEMWGP